MEHEVVIAINLIGRHLCSSWDRVTTLFAGTLVSVFAQTSTRYRVVVACNEIPDAHEIFADHRIAYLVLPSIDKETIGTRPSLDIWTKEAATRKWAADSGASYFFSLDADDLISNRLIDHIASAPPRAGFVIGQGYALDASSGRLGVLPRSDGRGGTFDRWCGSSIIVSMNPMIRPAARFMQLNLIFNEGHNKARERFKAALGDEAADVPFAAVVYRLNNGENFSQRERSSFGTWNSDIGRWIFDPEVTPDAALRAEFSLDGL